ncbi:MAG: translation elongation factor Ts [Deltaproteobacteria bacterium]|nr:translation elongation factor Ts [Deltaproteobacteria bacterium]
MAEISAAAVKDLRDRTGAGMMDCKKALADAAGDLEKATTLLRERGLAKAAKREGRETAEGTVALALAGEAGALVELGCETDFVARTDDFQRIARGVAEAAARDAGAGTVEGLSAAALEGETVAARIAAAAGKLGENVVLKRVARLAVPGGLVGGYVHAGGKLGVLVGLATAARGAGAEALAKDVAMHVAAADPSPVAVDRAGVPADLVQRERELFMKQAAQSGKPEKVIDKIVEGRVNKFYAEVVLLEQPFVKDPDRTIRELLERSGKELGGPVAVTAFVRFRLGADGHS